jgi:hypothetical protein
MCGLGRDATHAEKGRHLPPGLDLAAVIAKGCMLLPFTPHPSSIKQAGPAQAAP